MDLWETPDTIQTLLEYPTARQAYFEGRSLAPATAHDRIMAPTHVVSGSRPVQIHPERNQKIRLSEMCWGPARAGRRFLTCPGRSLGTLATGSSASAAAKSHAPAEAGVSAATAATWPTGRSDSAGAAGSRGEDG